MYVDLPANCIRYCFRTVADATAFKQRFANASESRSSTPRIIRRQLPDKRNYDRLGRVLAESGYCVQGQRPGLRLSERAIDRNKLWRLPWVFGLYEVLRVIKESETPKFQPLRDLFLKLEVLRMPLAKHEVKHVKGDPHLSHYPTGAWEMETGRAGWIFHDPHSKKTRILTRTGLADEFLSIAAIEPEFPPPVPIGGPLGADD
jgi:hypothetical protein